MNQEIRKLLIEHASAGNPISYGDIMLRLGLDSRRQTHRDHLSNILYEISKYENDNQRPLLSSIAMYAKSKDHGHGFYDLAEEFGYGNKRELIQSKFAYDQMNQCIKFWQEHRNYEQYYFEESFFKQLKKQRKPIGIMVLPETNPTFTGTNKNFIEESIKYKEIGDAGEELVKQYEIKWLESLGLSELSDYVNKVKDGMGYDIKSFDKNGNSKFIEVKTTTADKASPFEYSLNEYLFAQRNEANYLIYRLFNYNSKENAADFFIIDKPYIQLLLQPIQFRAYIKKDDE